MQSFYGRPLKANHFIAGAGCLNLPIFWSYEVVLIVRTEFDLVLVASHSGAKRDSDVATEA